MFGGHVVDLGWNVEFDDLSINGEHVTSREAAGWVRAGLTLCTTPEFYCLKSGTPGGLIWLAAPRRCSDDLREGTVWRVGEVATTVLKAWEAPWHQEWMRTHRLAFSDTGAAFVYLLGDPAHPQVVYRYEPGSGVTDLIVARKRGVDLVSRARQGQLPVFPQTSDDFRYARLSTPDSFAACAFTPKTAPRDS